MTVKELLCKAEEVAKKNRWTRGAFMQPITHKDGTVERAYCAVGFLRRAYWELNGQPQNDTLPPPYVDVTDPWCEATRLLASEGFGVEAPRFREATQAITKANDDSAVIKSKRQVVRAFEKACAAAPDA